jgi:hypothetical protein
MVVGDIHAAQMAVISCAADSELFAARLGWVSAPSNSSFFTLASGVPAAPLIFEHTPRTLVLTAKNEELCGKYRVNRKKTA